MKSVSSKLSAASYQRSAMKGMKCDGLSAFRPFGLSAFRPRYANGHATRTATLRERPRYAKAKKPPLVISHKRIREPFQGTVSQYT
ncbi:hypothetical protein [Moorena sp. SIO4G3]|uniref:hypothetical protein n=1 Tax=Moorena sp. SIO4G3 TaxID=2607821 RepID=UPI00142BABED|nr:hypothetical protein [Moorena sp. SIO4G3]NEO81315.1 hypothetical protein [Moorena sp. SIO4G3]